MKIGNREFEFGKKVYVMGILNYTPDSFSDGGKYNSVDKALEQVKKMISDGADVIDIGGESTRPGYKPVTVKEEINRVVPIISLLKKAFDIPLSIDTYKPEVAEAALSAGADMINDIWGLRRDDKMASLIAKCDIPVCIMHNREKTVYRDFLTDVISDLKESLSIAKDAGIEEKNIILDPGIGFAKSYEQNLQVINHLEQIVQLGYPVLLACSGKSVIGKTLDLPIGERGEGTLAVSVIGAMKGCGFVRVHDVKANVRALRMAEAISGA